MVGELGYSRASDENIELVGVSRILAEPGLAERRLRAVGMLMVAPNCRFGRPPAPAADTASREHWLTDRLPGSQGDRALHGDPGRRVRSPAI